ncbi:hypothetical protein BC833DRAFT_619434 [Globomyces pollinis-pini]|nr:hypothetical protein BC833DRAFT_619434 [Globomyces pollinis-pini]
MSKQELENYRFQLIQVQEALSKESNEELKKLEVDLKDLISLYESLDQPETESTKPIQSKPVASTNTNQSQPKSKPKPTKNFEIGDTALAKWKDGSFYEALIVGINQDSYECVFTGYESIEIITFDNIKEPKPGVPRPTLLTTKEVIISNMVEKTPSKKKKRIQKEKNVSKRDAFQKEKQNAWQSFASKSKVIKSKSLFSTADRPKAMTTFEKKSKHVYKLDDQ